MGDSKVFGNHYALSVIPSTPYAPTNMVLRPRWSSTGILMGIVIDIQGKDVKMNAQLIWLAKMQNFVPGGWSSLIFKNAETMRIVCRCVIVKLFCSCRRVNSRRAVSRDTCGCIA